MRALYSFSYETDWRAAPLAFWVHVPVPNAGSAFCSETKYEPAAPRVVPHKGFVFLRVRFDGQELLFRSPAQLAHFIEVLASKPLPTSRQLSERRGTSKGPNSHWLSRLPAQLKSPRNRGKLVSQLLAVQAEAVASGAGQAFDWDGFSASEIQP